MLKFLITSILVGAALGITYVIYYCPCERAPGLWLSGEEISTPVEDWTFANDAGLCQLEVKTWRPHSINLNCMSTGPDLFVSCSYCQEKYWSNTALVYPEGKIKIAGQLYPVRFERVTDPVWLDIAWRARALKLNREAGERPDHWWSFKLTSSTT